MGNTWFRVREYLAAGAEGGLEVTEENKAVVRRMVDEVINQGRLEVADELFTPEGAAAAREAFSGFRSAFPDWKEDIVDLVAEADKVVGHFKCTGALQVSSWGCLRPASAWRSMRCSSCA
jgi:hypothetical protein